MTTKIKVTLPPLHPAQLAVWEHNARFHVLSMGRRWGKSRLAALVLLASALRGGVGWWIAPSYAVGNVGFNEIRRLANQLPGVLINRSERTVTFASGGQITIRSADNPDLLRGHSLDFAIFDEAAYMSHLLPLWQEVIRPSLADRLGRAFFLSTPRGRNYFYQLFSCGLDPLRPDWKSWQLPTSSNPYIPAGEIEAMRESMTADRYQQEVLAQFLDGGSIFRNVDDLMKPEYGQDDPIPGHTYTIGVDIARVAGGDFTAISIYDATEGDICQVHRMTGLEYTLQMNRLQALIEAFKPLATVIETNNAGQAVLEQMKVRMPRARINGFATTNTSKAALVDQMCLAMERQELGFCEDVVLRTELTMFEGTTLPSGLTRYSAPDGGHDDTVISTLLAVGAGLDTGILRTPRGAKAGKIDY